MDEFASRHYPVREDMRFQHRSWRIERAGWMALAAIALAGLTGVFGVGPLSTGYSSAAPLGVRYERFQRATRVSAFVFTVAPTSSAELRLHLGGRFQRDFEVTSIQPRPARTATGPHGIDLIFAKERQAESRVVIWAHSRRYGLNRLAAAADGGPAAAFSVFVYP